MAPQCNIDAKGKAVRLLWGIAMFVIGGVVIALRLTGVLNGWYWWLIASAPGLLGVLAMYEARKGWCAVRAMGFKTPV